MTKRLDTLTRSSQGQVLPGPDAPEPKAPKSVAGTTAHQLGRWGDARGGHTLIAIGGVHGNEPAGVEAIVRVLSSLAAKDARELGRFVGLSGNPTALSTGHRYLDVDLNRVFTPAVLACADNPLDPHEYSTARGLALAIKRIVDESDGPVYAVDLHTTSSRSAPFVLFSDRLRNRAFAAHFRLPMILGLEESIEGALLDYLDSLGVLAVGVEGGRHGDPDSVDNLESILWEALVSARVIERSAVDDLEARSVALGRLGEGLPRVLEVRYRHALQTPSSFRMTDGFTNLDRIRKGQVIAYEAGHEVRACESGCLLLPRYQALGTDGFFIARPVSPMWLRVSTVLRRLRIDRLLPLLPGVSVESARPRAVTVDTRVARLFPLQVLHLLGYRRLRSRGSELVARPRDV